MSNKNYFENIGAKLGLIVNHFRILRLLAIIAYLVFLAILIIDVFTAIGYVPSTEEVKGKFLPITAKNDIIGSIERYFLDRENSLDKNLQKELSSNPFAPHRIADVNPSDSPAVSPAISPVASPIAADNNADNQAPPLP